MMATGTRTVGSLSFGALATLNHHTLGLIVGAVVVVLTALVPVLTKAISEMFWFGAQNKSERSLKRVLGHTTSIAEAERLMRLLRSAQRDVLDARSKAGRDKPE
nr:hypothetical protein [Kibdelosporangium sp. MJ126-NF4]CEL21412.1 hypothetical protein [Kibdelosporangium sp. MJ126-NF4]CTQ96021.1 hypothetical protein [Kibdelosporangium sp. MJ126-NF4]